MEKEKEKYWLKEGESVVHVSNINQIMTIDKLLYRRAEIFCNENEPNATFSTELRRFVRNKKLLVGVNCRWVVDGGKIESLVFHSRELIPYDIAKQGVDAINKFRQR